VIDKLNQVTVLFGRNGIGKSILLRALRAQNPQSYHYASPERAGEISHDMSMSSLI
jgi:ABC-type cobalamin/Fe3+-siderophores transport system ATPase subunit